MEKPGGEPTLHDEPPELRPRSERRVEVQRVMVARNIREFAAWSAVSVRLREERWPTAIDM